AYRCHLHHEHLLSFPTRRSSDLNLDQALDVELNLTPEVTLDAVVAAHVIADRLDLSFSQILDARVRVDTRPAQNLVRPGAANSIDVCECDFDPLVTRQVDTFDTSHNLSLQGFSSQRRLFPREAD